MASTRDQIINTTAKLLESQGYHATGLNQIVAESGAPKGSLYYYFPEGKEELTAEAISLSGRIIAGHIRDSLAAIPDPGEAIAGFIHELAKRVVDSQCRGGSAITIVALETAGRSERLNRVCREMYALWQAEFADKLVQSGFKPQRAEELAVMVMAAIEGGIVLSRTRTSAEPLERIATELRRYLSTVLRD